MQTLPLTFLLRQCVLSSLAPNIAGEGRGGGQFSYNITAMYSYVQLHLYYDW